MVSKGLVTMMNRRGVSMGCPKLLSCAGIFGSDDTKTVVMDTSFREKSDVDSPSQVLNECMHG